VEALLFLLGASAPLREMLFAALMLALLLSPSTIAAEDRPPAADLSSLVGLLELVIEADADSAKQCLQTLGAKIRSGEADAGTLAELQKRLSPPLAKILAGKADDPLVADAALVAALWKDAGARRTAAADGEHLRAPPTRTGNAGVCGDKAVLNIIRRCWPLPERRLPASIAWR
jgi:hypothetical protein